MQYKAVYSILKNMGLRYVLFRIELLFKKKIGWYLRVFPTSANCKLKNYSKNEWLNLESPFNYFGGYNYVTQQKEELIKKVSDYKKGLFTFFSAQNILLGEEYDWVTNPVTNFRYSNKDHFSSINDFDSKSGDIKYVWEKARFSWIYDVIKKDVICQTNEGEWVIEQIIDFIEHNPINCGPNWKCSQEISLRLFNWWSALQYYKDNEALSEDNYNRIMNYCYWQLHHVYHNIQFSRVAVRNNHAITETLCLALSNWMFPFIDETKKWSRKGKYWFEKEIAYQIYEDGTFLQFSMNYNRVVVQLLTMAYAWSNFKKVDWSSIVAKRAKATLLFLYNSQFGTSGNVPNYGANDGALFFPLSVNDYTDYRPQLQALGIVLGMKDLNYKLFEDAYYWQSIDNENKSEAKNVYSLKKYFPDGGYYINRNNRNATFVRLGKHKNRPSQADNLHIDIWVNGINMLRDAGSFRYNTSETDKKYFMGTDGHNCVMLGDNDQMLKGPRFIWYHWSQAELVYQKEFEDYTEVKARMSGFKHVANNIIHERTVRMFNEISRWEIIDEIVNKPSNVAMRQLWHPNSKYLNDINISAQSNNNILDKKESEGYFSEYYGCKEVVEDWCYETMDNQIVTSIEILN